ncbi:hypothetical protein BASA81_001684 [Batrachochytrium salamandrivorans]|nr:hypothetical protein BASA81_001684 [Batrachochytrium salamandrivorans]
MTNPVAQVFIAIAVFVLSGLLEIVGGWLVWQTLRSAKPWYFALGGSLMLVGYGFAATLNPLSDFARVYAIYGGVFILLSVIWGAILDGFRPDVGDYVGLALVVAGACVMSFWPRTNEGEVT